MEFTDYLWIKLMVVVVVCFIAGLLGAFKGR
jgi:hypothetical protein